MHDLQKSKWQIFISVTALGFIAGGSYVNVVAYLLTEAHLSSCWGLAANPIKKANTYISKNTYFPLSIVHQICNSF